MFTCVLADLSESADRVGAQLRGDKECPFSGVTNSGIVRRKVPESDARSVYNEQWVFASLQEFSSATPCLCVLSLIHI